MPPPPPRRRRSGARRLIAAVALALVAHALMVGVLLLAGSGPRSPARQAPPQAVAMRTLSSEEWDRNRGRSAPTDRKVPELPKPSKEQPKGQVVAVAPGNDQAPPEDSKFLAETNNRVEKQTRSRETSADYKNAMPQRTTDKPRHTFGEAELEQAKQEERLGVGNQPADVPLSSGDPALEIPRVQKRTAVALKPSEKPGPGPRVDNRNESQELEGNAERLALNSGGDEQSPSPPSFSSGQRRQLRLVPSAAALGDVEGAAANDYLKDIDEGRSTQLNTRRFEHAPYFNAVNRQVSQKYDWNELVKRDPTGRIYLWREQATTVLITLDAKGRLMDVFVAERSGIDFLDREVVRAIERAQPFAAPPEGLMAGYSMIRFTATFVLPKVRAAPQVIFREAN